MKEVKGDNKVLHWDRISTYLMVYDFIAICFSYFAALWLRFDGKFGSIPKEYLMPYAKFILPYAVICILLEKSKRDAYVNRANTKKVMLIGAGSAGQIILRELMHAKKIRGIGGLHHR